MLSYRCFIVYFPMSKPSSTISSAVSIRVSNELLDAVREYAISHNLINNSGRPDKRGEPNLSQAFSELVRLGLGQEITVSDSASNPPNDDLKDTVKKLSDSVSILSDKIEERENHLKDVLNQVEDLRLKVHSQETYSLLYDHLKADVDIRFDATNKAIAALTSKAKVSHEKASDAIPKTEGDSDAEITGEVIEPDGLPIIEAISNIAAPTVENPLPDETLSNAIAATAKPKTTKKQSKKALSEMNVEQAHELAQSRGYGGSLKSFKEDFSRKREAFGSRFGLKRWKKEEGHTTPYSYLDTLS